MDLDFLIYAKAEEMEESTTIMKVRVSIDEEKDTIGMVKDKLCQSINQSFSLIPPEETKQVKEQPRVTRSDINRLISVAPFLRISSNDNKQDETLFSDSLQGRVLEEACLFLRPQLLTHKEIQLLQNQFKKQEFEQNTISLTSKDEKERKEIKRLGLATDQINNMLSNIFKSKKENKKTKTKDENKSAKIIQKAYKDFLTRKIKIVQSGNWITGSDGAMIFPMLAKTGLTLTPTGDLLSQKIAPLCGELNNAFGIGISGLNMKGLSGTEMPDVSKAQNKKKSGEPDVDFETPWGYAQAKRKYASTEDIIENQKNKLRNLIRNTARILRQYYPSNEYEFVTLVTLLLTALQLQQLDSEAYIEFKSDVENVAKMVTERGADFWEPLLDKGGDNIELVTTMKNNIQMIVDAFSSIESKIKFTLDERKKIDSALEKKQDFPVVFVALHMNPYKMTKGVLAMSETSYQGQLTLGKEIKIIVTDQEHRQEVYNFLKDNNLLQKVFICEKEHFLELRLRDVSKLFDRDQKKQTSENTGEVNEPSPSPRSRPGKTR